MRVGIPWVLSSESKLINGLREIFCGSFSVCSLLAWSRPFGREMACVYQAFSAGASPSAPVQSATNTKYSTDFSLREDIVDFF
jgi:hypothetical protein